MYNKNYRNNPSLLIQRSGQNIVIDVGKTFREGALRWFPQYNVASIDAIVLTHPHMDAAAGLDDVRGVQYYHYDEQGRFQAEPMPLYVSQTCLDEIVERFPWLFPRHVATKTTTDQPPQVERHVASFDVHIFAALQPMVVQGLKIVPLPVWHGEDLISYGFSFTVGSTNVVYLSDISRMPEETLEYIQTQLPPTDVLIIDALHPERANAVHYSLQQALALVDQIQPKQTYVIGMNCDSFPPHDTANDELRRSHGNVQLAYDGLAIDC